MTRDRDDSTGRDDRDGTGNASENVDGPAALVRGVVLAGGDSTRFGDRDKALARVGDGTIVGRVFDVLSDVTGARPIVVVDDEVKRRRIADAASDGTTPSPAFATDDPAAAGPLAGLFGAAEATDAPWLLVVACDMPFLDRGALEWLCERRDGEGDAIVPRTPDGWDPLHALYRRASVLGARSELPSDAGLHTLVAILDQVVPVDSADGPSSLRASLTNVNTPADLEAARERLADAGTGGDGTGDHDDAGSSRWR